MTSRLPAFGIAALIVADLVLASGASKQRAASSRGTLLSTGSMHVARAVHTATLVSDGSVLVAGGMQKNGVFEDSAELYDPASGRFEILPKLSSRRVGHSATLLPNGRVLIAGGSAGRRFEGGRWIGNVVVTAELYDPATRSFRSAGSMSAPRAHQAAVRLADGRVLLAGGYDASSGALGSAEIYDPASGAFRPTGSLKTPRTPDVAVL
ncbi:MAG: Kelch repeat-containing protein, partial [Thermoanaerobaculia bacterium]